VHCPVPECDVLRLPRIAAGMEYQAASLPSTNNILAVTQHIDLPYTSNSSMFLFFAWFLHAWKTIIHYVPVEMAPNLKSLVF